MFFNVDLHVVIDHLQFIHHHSTTKYCIDLQKTPPLFDPQVLAKR